MPTADSKSSEPIVIRGREYFTWEYVPRSAPVMDIWTTRERAAELEPFVGESVPGVLPDGQGVSFLIHAVWQDGPRWVITATPEVRTDLL